MQTSANVAPLALHQTGSANAVAPPGLEINAAISRSPSPSLNLLPPAAPAPRIEIANGNGSVGMAQRVRVGLSTRGVTGFVVLSNVLPYDTLTTVVRYRDGFAGTAQLVADGIGPRRAITPLPGGTLNADVRVVLGRDQL